MADVSGPTDTPDSAAERRSRLLGVKLRALVAEHLGREFDGETGPFPNGAAMVVDGAAWVVVDGPASRSLGGALAWAIRHGATSLDLIAESDTGLLARRAERFRFPITVWFSQDRSLLPAVSEPLPESRPAAPEHVALFELIEASGATPNVEHGVVFGEVRGLEVCRVVDEPTVGHFAELGDVDPTAQPLDVPEARSNPGVQLEVGVGANDREAFTLLHGHLPTVEALSGVVASVVAYRSREAVQHPLNRLGAERFLRWQLEQSPELVGADAVVPTEPPVPRPNLKDPVPSVARATSGDGSEWYVVCSTGVDVDLVPFVADVQLMTQQRSGVSTEVTVVTPERDLVAITRDLAGLLAEPVRLRTV